MKKAPHPINEIGEFLDEAQSEKKTRLMGGPDLLFKT